MATDTKTMEKIHLDYTGPFYDKMWLICVDAFSKFQNNVKC